MQIYFVTFPHRKQHVLFVYDITIPIKKIKGVSNYTNAFVTENEHFLSFNQRQSIPGATEIYIRFFLFRSIFPFQCTPICNTEKGNLETTKIPWIFAHPSRELKRAFFFFIFLTTSPGPSDETEKDEAPSFVSSRPFR